MRVGSCVRWVFGALVVAGAAWGLSGCAVTTALVVTTSVDSHDVSVGDGTCADGAGRCSLRAALEEASAGSVAVDVTVPAGSYPLSLGSLSVGSGAHAVAVHAPQPGAVVDAVGAGSGVVVGSGSVTVLGLAVTGASGPGVVVASGASLRLGAVSVHHNAVGVQVAAGGSVTAAISTVADNAGAGFANAGSVDATNVTVTANGAGGFTGSGSVVLGSSVVADQVAGANCAGPVTSAGFNLVSDGSCLPAAGTDVVAGSGAKLGALSADALAAHKPLVGSPVVDSGPGSCAGGDQFGLVRPVGLACDRGAVEANFAPLALAVNTAADHDDVAPGDGVCDDGTGHCPLRAAVTETNLRPTAGTHTVALKADPVLSIAPVGGDDNASGDLDVLTNLTIGAGFRTISGGGVDRVFHHHAGHLTLTATNTLTVTGGVRDEPGARGGGIATDAQLTLDHVNVAGNRATGPDAAGGGIHGSATASITITRSTIQHNQANAILELSRQGGAIAVDGSTLSVTDSLLDANSAGRGGAIGATGATVSITRSTLTGNAAGSDGGALDLSAGATTVTESTIVGNVAAAGFPGGPTSPGGAGSAIAAAGPVTLRHVTLDHNGPSLVGIGITGDTPMLAGASWVTVAGSIVVPYESRVCDGAAVSGGYNVVADLSCGLTGPGDQQNANPVLGPIGSHGGPTPTILAAANSPAVNAIPAGTAQLCDASTPTDQRGTARPAGVGCDIGAVEGAGPAVTPLALVVDVAADGVDVSPGDGVCADVTGHCTLRAAIGETNARPTTDTITIQPGIDPALSYTASSSSLPPVDGLDVTDWLVLHGNGATLDANRAYWAVANHARGLIIDHLTVTDSLVAGVHSGAGTLWFTEGTVRDGSGPGIMGEAATVIVTSSTISGNDDVLSEGGGLRLTGGRLTVRNTTIDGNWTSTRERGAAIDLRGVSAQLRGVTVVGNDGAPSVVSDGPVDLGGSVVVAGPTFPACAAPIVGPGHNVVGDRSCALTGPGDLEAVNPVLGPLGANGGPTATRLPYGGSPALNLIPAGTPGLCDGATPIDQRGSARPAGGACDVGAVEGAGPTLVPGAFTVDTALDGVDANPGDGVCAAAGGTCTLRAAVTEANLRPTTDTITIGAGSNPTLTIAGASEDGNLTGDLDVTDWLVLHGNGATVDANHLDRAFQLSGPVQVAIDHLTVIGGHTPGAYEAGGGILSGVNINLDHVTLTGNTSLERGGAIATRGADTVLSGVQVTGNHSGYGGAVDADGPVLPTGAGATFSLTDSTVAGNEGNGLTVRVPTATLSRNRSTANTAAGIELWADALIEDSTVDHNGSVGIASYGNLAGPTIRNSTVTDNAGGLYLSSARATIRSSTIVDAAQVIGGPAGLHLTHVAGSILAGPPGHVCLGMALSDGYNVVSDSGCVDSVGPSTDRTGVTPLLQALADNGGPTPTRLPYAESPATDFIPMGTTGLCDASTPTDQRGVARPQGAACEAGAAEGSAGPAPALSVTVTSGLDTHDAVPGDLVCADAGGACTLRAAIDEADAGGSLATITIAPGIDPTLSLAGAYENGNASGDLDIRADVTIHGNGAVVDGAQLDRVIDVRSGSLTADHLTVRNGRATDEPGAGIRATGGALTLDRVTITANSNTDINDSPYGAGVSASDAVVSITSSVVSGNSAVGAHASGGGLAFSGQQSVVTITDTTISGNTLPSGGSGGGLFVSLNGIVGGSGTFTLQRSTVSGNVVGTFGSAGGGLFANSPATITDSTFSGNTAFNGAALEVYAPVSLVRSTVVGNTGFSSLSSRNLTGTSSNLTIAGTVVSQGNGQACFGPIMSGGYNAATDTSCALAGVGDVQPAVVQLGSLASNSGPTQTHLPAVGSPLVDAIPVGTAGLCDGSVTVDQRGLPRPSGAACDIGSVER